MIARTLLLSSLCSLACLVLPVRAGAVSMLEGSEVGGRFGFSVIDAGDLNGDGRPDFAVGAPLDDTGGAQRGRVFVWFGGPSIPVAAAVVLSGERGGDHFGWCVRGVGDLNGDGVDDLAVGAPLAASVNGDTGEVYVYFGGPGFGGTPDRTLAGEVAGDLFGWTIAGGVDVYAGSDPDLIVGAPGFGFDQGAVYVFAGTGLAQSPHLRLTGTDGSDFFGYAVAEVSDFRGNASGSFLVGAPGAFGFGGTIDAPGGIGEAYLFLKDPTGPAATFANPGGSVGEEFGFALSEIGDVDNDGFTDVAVGAPGDTGDTGAVHVFRGQSTVSATPSPASSLFGATSGDRFGAAVTEIGDHDGGPLDWAVAAPMRDEGAADAGAVYVFGGLATSRNQATLLTPVNRSGTGTAGDHWGSSVAPAGDLDGDGRVDLLVGSPDANGANTSILGIVALFGSGSGVVALPELRVDRVRRVGGWIEFLVEGTGPVSDARIETPEGAVLARLGAGLVFEGSGLRARIESALVEAGGRLRLVWEEPTGAVRGSDFRLPVLPAGALVLHVPYPNPFNPRTTVRFELPAWGAYRLTVVDVRGRVVRELDAGSAGPGELRVEFDGRDGHGRPLASGTYRVVLRAEGRQRSRTITLVE